MKLPAFLHERHPGEIAMTGHRIGLYSIVRDYTADMSASELHDEFPTLPVELIEKVIGFYLANKAEVDEYMVDNQAKVDRQEAAGRHIDLNKLRQRYAELNPGLPIPGLGDPAPSTHAEN
jgi:uncharacterized protein (DUF433 family)